MGHGLDRYADRDGRRAPLQHKSLEALPPGLQGDGVLIGTRNNVGQTAFNRRQGLRTPRKITDIDLQTFGLEITELLSDGQGQVVKRCFTPHCNGYLRFFKSGLRPQGRRSHRSCRTNRDRKQVSAVEMDVVHGQFSWDLSFCPRLRIASPTDLRIGNIPQGFVPSFSVDPAGHAQWCPGPHTPARCPPAHHAPGGSGAAPGFSGLR